MERFESFGRPEVKELLARRDIPGLVNALNCREDSAIRLSAAQALGEIGDVRAADPLSFVFQDKDATVRQAAVNVLMRIDNARAIDELFSMLKGEDAELRHWALDALSKSNWQTNRAGRVVRHWGLYWGNRPWAILP